MNDAVIFIYGLCFPSLRFKNVKYTLWRNNLHRIKPAHRSVEFSILFRHTPLFLLLPAPHQAPWCSSPVGQPHSLTARTTTVLTLEIARTPCECFVLFLLLLSSPLTHLSTLHLAPAFFHTDPSPQTPPIPQDQRAWHFPFSSLLQVLTWMVL